MNSPVAVLKQCVDALMSRRCPACGGRPTLSGGHSSFDDEVVIRVSCHGVHEQLALDGWLLSGGGHEVGDKISDFARNLFVLDANPDVRELLHYNRGATPEARR